MNQLQNRESRDICRQTTMTALFLVHYVLADPFYRYNKRVAVTAAKISRFTATATARFPQKHAGCELFFPTLARGATQPGEGYKRAPPCPVGRRIEAASAVLSWSRSRTAFDISIRRFGIEATSNSMPPPRPPPASTSFPRPLWKSGGDGESEVVQT